MKLKHIYSKALAERCFTLAKNLGWVKAAHEGGERVVLLRALSGVIHLATIQNTARHYVSAVFWMNAAAGYLFAIGKKPRKDYVYEDPYSDDPTLLVASVLGFSGHILTDYVFDPFFHFFISWETVFGLFGGDGKAFEEEMDDFISQEIFFGSLF